MHLSIKLFRNLRLHFSIDHDLSDTSHWRRTSIHDDDRPIFGGADRVISHVNRKDEVKTEVSDIKQEIASYPDSRHPVKSPGNIYYR